VGKNAITRKKEKESVQASGKRLAPGEKWQGGEKICSQKGSLRGKTKKPEKKMPVKVLEILKLFESKDEGGQYKGKHLSHKEGPAVLTIQSPRVIGRRGRVQIRGGGSENLLRGSLHSKVPGRKRRGTKKGKEMRCTT